MTENVTATQADCDCMNAILGTIASSQNGALKDADHDHVADIIVEKITRLRLAAEATQAAEIARLNEELSDEASRSRMAKNNALNGTPVMVLRSLECGGYSAGFYTLDEAANPDNMRAEIARLRDRRLLLIKSNCAVRDGRWLITIDASGHPCAVRVIHREYGDFYDWPEAAMGPDCRGGVCPAADRAYAMQDDSNFYTKSAAMKAAHDFIRRFGAGEVEYLEFDADSQSMVVVGHSERRGMPWMRPHYDDKPCPLAPFYESDTLSTQPSEQEGGE